LKSGENVRISENKKSGANWLERLHKSVGQAETESEESPN
jgi:hypothetical protein